MAMATIFTQMVVIQRFDLSVQFLLRVGAAVMIASFGLLIASAEYGLFVSSLALAGVGFAYMYEPFARAALASGALVSVLDDWCLSIPGFYLYYPSRKLPTATLAAFIEMVKAAQRQG